jgi:hypothetical protein
MNKYLLRTNLPRCPFVFEREGAEGREGYRAYRVPVGTCPGCVVFVGCKWCLGTKDRRIRTFFLTTAVDFHPYGSRVC